MSERRDSAWWKSWYPKHIPVAGDLLMTIDDLTACEQERDSARIAAQGLLRSYDKEHARAERAEAARDDYRAYCEALISGNYTPELAPIIARIESRRKA